MKKIFCDYYQIDCDKEGVTDCEWCISQDVDEDMEKIDMRYESDGKQFLGNMLLIILLTIGITWVILEAVRTF